MFLGSLYYGTVGQLDLVEDGGREEPHYLVTFDDRDREDMNKDETSGFCKLYKADQNGIKKEEWGEKRKAETFVLAK